MYNYDLQTMICLYLSYSDIKHLSPHLFPYPIDPSVSKLHTITAYQDVTQIVNHQLTRLKEDKFKEFRKSAMNNYFNNNTISTSQGLEKCIPGILSNQNNGMNIKHTTPIEFNNFITHQNQSDKECKIISYSLRSYQAIEAINFQILLSTLPKLESIGIVMGSLLISLIHQSYLYIHNDSKYSNLVISPLFNDWINEQNLLIPSLIMFYDCEIQIKFNQILTPEEEKYIKLQIDHLDIKLNKYADLYQHQYQNFITQHQNLQIEAPIENNQISVEIPLNLIITQIKFRLFHDGSPIFSPELIDEISIIGDGLMLYNWKQNDIAKLLDFEEIYYPGYYQSGIYFLPLLPVYQIQNNTHYGKQLIEDNNLINFSRIDMPQLIIKFNRQNIFGLVPYWDKKINIDVEGTNINFRFIDNGCNLMKFIN